MESENPTTNAVSGDFDCGICLFLMVEPSKTPCGHRFCLTCLEEVLIYKSSCPFCRAAIKSGFKPKLDVKLQEEIKTSNKEAFIQREEELKKLRHENEKNFKLRIVYGNDHEIINDPTNYNVHKWCAYVRLANKNDNIAKYISKVAFQLHPTFANPKRVKTSPPFQVSCRGWGVFLLPITIEWREELGLENTEVKHFLSFDGNGDYSALEVAGVVNKTLSQNIFDE